MAAAHVLLAPLLTPIVLAPRARAGGALAVTATFHGSCHRSGACRLKPRSSSALRPPRVARVPPDCPVELAPLPRTATKRRSPLPSPRRLRATQPAARHERDATSRR